MSIDCSVPHFLPAQPRTSILATAAMSLRSKYGYVLEVVKFVKPEDLPNPENAPLYTHVGYMPPIFRTISDACAYYDQNNPHMRSLNAHSTLCSDWDPHTRLACIVRENYFIRSSVRGFDPKTNFGDENSYTFKGVTWTAVTKTSSDDKNNF